VAINRNLKEAIVDRLSSWELVDFLQIPCEFVVEAFEAEIEANLDDVLDFVDLREYKENEKDYEENIREEQ